MASRIASRSWWILRSQLIERQLGLSYLLKIMAILAKCNHCGLERAQDLHTFDLGEQFVPAGIPTPIFSLETWCCEFQQFGRTIPPHAFSHNRNMRQLLITACFNRRNHRLVEVGECRRNPKKDAYLPAL